MSYSQTIGTGRDAPHVSFFYNASAEAAKGTFICTVICERWIAKANPKGRTRKSTGISVPKKFIVKDGKVSEKAPNVDEVRKNIESVFTRIRKVYEEHMRNRSHHEDFLRKSKVEDVIDAREVFDGDDVIFVTRSTPIRGARGVEYGGFVRRFMDEYVTAGGKTYAESPSAMANAQTMAFNMYLFSQHYYDGKLTVHDLADPEQAPILAAKLIRFFTEESDKPMVDESLDNILTRLRTALSWAHRKGLVRNLDLTPYYFNAARQPKFTLLVSEFLQVAQHAFGEKETRLERARDLWIFPCLTALRYKDSHMPILAFHLCMRRCREDSVRRYRHEDSIHRCSYDYVHAVPRMPPRSVSRAFQPAGRGDPVECFRRPCR